MARESRLFRQRVLFASVVLLVLVVALLGRMIYLQVTSHQHYKTLSHNNRVRIVPIAPTRGLILDRNGVVLAQNAPTHSLEIVPEAVVDMDALIKKLAGLVDVSDADVARFEREAKRKRRFDSVPLRFNLNDTEVARLSVELHNLPGVSLVARLTRDYPLGPLGVHAVGYVGRIDEAELKRLDGRNYRASTHIGKTGVEVAYEADLHGVVGYQSIEANARGRVLRVLDRHAPIPGDDLHLTLDASLQTVAETALGSENGAVVAIEPQTGGILAMASMPGFDPNLFVNGIDVVSYRELSRSPARPLFNRVLSGRYPPGSTVKPFIGLAGLELDPKAANKDIWCPGFFMLKGHSHKYRDWKKAGHGRVNLKSAIAESCDVYFYELALKLGIDPAHDFLDKFGFGQRTGIDLKGEVRGILPSRAWKRRKLDQPWYPGETLIAGIGQGFTAATPLQLAVATAALGMRGRRMSPRIVGRQVNVQKGTDVVFAPTVAETIEISRPQAWERVARSMEEVVHGARGTARRVGHNARFRIAGKTGTAQVKGIGQEEKYDETKIAKRFHDHALFIAFAPAERPLIAVAVIVENGGSGSKVAAPIARKLMDHYLFGRARKQGKKDLLLTSMPAPPAVRP